MSNFTPTISAHQKISTLKPNCGCKAAICSRNEVSVSAKSSQFARNRTNFGSASSSGDDYEQEPPQKAVLKAISEISKTDGRVRQTTNLVIGGTVTDDSTNEWLSLYQKVNSYPTVRGFTAIATRGDDFVHAMVVAVESVIHWPIPEVSISHL
ncbi:uncharacterized protein [Primulina huaijiensis]|uniref:uncharacterized protein n=1 Tax=Primulina huaijiensis TaxID=1492673 RepID=UPI003CC73170